MSEILTSTQLKKCIKELKVLIGLKETKKLIKPIQIAHWSDSVCGVDIMLYREGLYEDHWSGRGEDKHTWQKSIQGWKDYEKIILEYSITLEKIRKIKTIIS